MSKFTMEIDLGNAAFYDDDGDFDPAQELSDILAQVKRHVANGFTSARVLDTNGNHVGFWKIEEN